MSLKLCFMGTAAFAEPSLKACLAAGHRVGLVLSQPDRPRGRGHQLQPTPLKAAALALGLRVAQPERCKSPEAMELIAAEAPDALVVAAYGQILPQALLDLPRLGALNVHASLLPRWRGAAPVEWALAAGDELTGVAVQRMVLKLDAGPLLAARELPIGPEDDAASLTQRLSELGAEALVEALALLEAGKAEPRPQDEALATLAPLLGKAESACDLRRPCQEVERRCRAFSQRIGYSLCLEGGAEALKLHRLKAEPGLGGEPGLVLEASEKGIVAACGRGAVRILELQPAGGRRMAAGEYLRGRKLAPGARFALPT